MTTVLIVLGVILGLYLLVKIGFVIKTLSLVGGLLWMIFKYIYMATIVTSMFGIKLKKRK